MIVADNNFPYYFLYEIVDCCRFEIFKGFTYIFNYSINVCTIVIRILSLKFLNHSLLQIR